MDYRRCRALHRRWIHQVNWCAANPISQRTVIARAPECIAPYTTYITLKDVEPFYDECVRPHQARRLQTDSSEDRISIKREAVARSSTLCAYWPLHQFANGRCEPGQPAGPQGGVLLVGDSIAWRGTDELGPLEPTWDVDGYPGRRFSDLAQRLTWFDLAHGQPSGLILELGTNGAPRFSAGDLRSILDGLPATTLVMLVTPYRVSPHAPPEVAPFTGRYARWYEQIARTRPNTCLGDWRGFVEAHRDVLVDGVHPSSANEGLWARWTASHWSACSAHMSTA